MTAANSRTATVAFKAIAANAGFVRPNGRRFSYGGKDFWRESAVAAPSAAHRYCAAKLYSHPVHH
jgi:hypothetical protein